MSTPIEALQQPGMLQQAGNFIADRFEAARRSSLMRIGLALGTLTALQAYDVTPAEAAPSDEVVFNPYCVQKTDGSWHANIGVKGPRPPETDTLTARAGNQSSTSTYPPGEGKINMFVEMPGPEFSGNATLTYNSTHYADATSADFVISCPSNQYPNNVEGGPLPTRPTPSPTTPATAPPQTSPTTSKDIGRGVNPGTTKSTTANTTSSLTPPVSETLGTNTTTQTTEVSTSIKETAKGLDSDENSSDSKFSPIGLIFVFSSIAASAAAIHRIRRRAH